MNIERQDITPHNFIEEVSGNPMVSVRLECTNVNTGYEYKFIFFNDHPGGPYIIIDTEPRDIFLTKGTETEAEEALKQLAFAIREKTGGYFNIHPFYGAVSHTSSSTVSKDFGSNFGDDDLSMIIYLTDKGDFDPRLTEEYLDIGLEFAVPSAEAQKFLEYKKQVKEANPNQEHRDQAIANGLGEKWDAEFNKYNPKDKILPVMNITPEHVVGLIQHLQSQLGLDDFRIPRVILK